MLPHSLPPPEVPVGEAPGEDEQQQWLHLHEGLALLPGVPGWHVLDTGSVWGLGAVVTAAMTLMISP